MNSQVNVYTFHMLHKTPLKLDDFNPNTIWDGGGSSLINSRSKMFLHGHSFWTQD